MDVGLANELKLAFRRANWTTADIKKFSEGNWAEQILPVLRGTATVQIVKHLIDLAGDCMPREWRKENWTIHKHIGNGMLELDASRLGLYFSPNQQNGSVIISERLFKELKGAKVPVLNACVLDYILIHPELIPENWKKDKNGNIRHIYFWGTVYRRPSVGLCVRYLYWDDAWHWDHRWLDNVWHYQGPAAVLASVPQP